MKRGLVLLDPKEVPPGELEGRVDALQESMAEEGVAATLTYGDVYRSGDITYLSNICLYWNEALLVVPAKGGPALLAKLSPRVHPWMRSTSNLEDLRSGQSLAGLVASYLGDTAPGVLGLTEMDWWPGTLVEELERTLPGWELRDLGDVVRRRRRSPSTSELALLRSGAAVTARAVRAGMEDGLTNPERAKRAELSARMGGVEDAAVSCDRTDGEADTVELSSEYRGYWTLAARVVPHGEPDWAGALAQAYGSAEAALAPGADLGELRSAAGRHLDGRDRSWQIDLIAHTDLETAGGYRLASEMAETLAEGAVVGLRLELAFSDGSRAVVADTYEIVAKGATRLTGDLPPVLVRS